MDTYKQEFQAAFDRTINYGFSHPPLRLVDTLLIPSKEKEYNAAINSFGITNSDELAYKCIDISRKLLPHAKRIFGDAYLTIGYVLKQPVAHLDPLFIYGEYIEDYLVKMGQGIKLVTDTTKEFPGHVWLTLPSLEILDLTLYTSISKKKNDPSLRGIDIRRHPSSFVEGLAFHPLILGDDFLRKVING